MLHTLSHTGNTNQSDFEIPEWLSSRKQTVTNVLGCRRGGKELLAIAIGYVNQYSHYRNQYGGSSKN
jgi:hypothetical protein